MDLLNEHDLLDVFARLPIIDKIRLRSVSPLWKDLLEETLRTKQKVLADHESSMNYCQTQGHRVQRTDIIQYPMIAKMRQFELILKLCPNLEVIHIMVFNDSSEEGTEQLEHFEPTFQNTFQSIRLIAKHCPKLTCVEFLYYYPMTGGQGYYNLVAKFNKGFELLASCCPQLVHLNLPYMSEDGLRTILALGGHVQSLVSWNFNGTGQVFRHLPASLSVLITEQLSLAAFDNLIRSDAASSLRTFGFRLDQEDMLKKLCGKIINLRKLCIWICSTDVQLSELVNISNLKQLQVLELSVTCSATIFRDDYSALYGIIFKKCSELVELRVLHFPINDKFFSNIQHSSKLEVIILIECSKLSSNESEHPAILFDDGLSDDVLDALALLPALRTIRISCKNWFTPKGLLALMSSCLKLEAIGIHRCEQRVATESVIGVMENYALRYKRNLRVDIASSSCTFRRRFSCN